MRNNLLTEICTRSNLNEYRSVLEDILLAIHKSGCGVNTRDDSTQSSYVKSEGSQPFIRLSLKGDREPLFIIWRLLHEYGHHLSGERKPDDSDAKRELLAWEKAEGVVLGHPILAVHIDSFRQCRKTDLNTYGVA